jgi:Tfp pilus assembly protein FimT
LHTQQTGLTFLDMLLVLVLMSIIAAYAVMRMNSTAENTLWYQAQRFAHDLRHAQILATTYGKPLQVTATAGVNGTYSVSCVTAGVTPPCNSSPIVDPLTGSAFTVTFQHGVTLGVSGTNPAPFDSLGRPLSGGAISTTNPNTTYTLTANGTTATIRIRPITGFVDVSL